MMGLEPTTFCMATGSWVRPIRRSKPHRFVDSTDRETDSSTVENRSILRTLTCSLGSTAQSTSVPTCGADPFRQPFREPELAADHRRRALSLERLGRPQRLLGHRRHTARVAVRQRSAQRVPRPGLPRPPSRVAVPPHTGARPAAAVRLGSAVVRLGNADSVGAQERN